MTRSKYIGVYDNNHIPSNKDHPYRMAIKIYRNGNPEYTNHGYFKLEETAAFVYNIYAIGTFGKGAVINDVEFSDEVEKEVELYSDTKEGFQTILNRALTVLDENGTDITVISYD